MYINNWVSGAVAAKSAGRYFYSDRKNVCIYVCVYLKYADIGLGLL